MNGLNQTTAQRITHRIHSRLFRLLGPAFFTLCLCLLFGCAGTTAERAFSSIEISSQFLQQTVQLPVLMYHHLIPEDSSESETPVSCFRDQMRALSEAGYHPVSFDEILRWVEDGGTLPSKPIAITFDDGYASNYELAYPVLREFGFQATIFVIGVSVGKDTYKNTGRAITPHFSLEQGREMEASGLISIQSHGYNLHEKSGLDPDPIRKGILRREGESEADYLAFLHGDCANMKALLGKTPEVLSYPRGKYNDMADAVLREEGIRITLTTKAHMNTLTRGDLQCLWRLGRFSCSGNMTGEELLKMLASNE